MKEYGGVDVQIHIFLTSTLVGGEGSTSHSGRSHYPLDRRLGETGIGLDVKRRKILPFPALKLQPDGRPVPNQSLYRLRYPICPSINVDFHTDQ
jgi:hypothetical protein